MRLAALEQHGTPGDLVDYRYRAAVSPISSRNRQGLLRNSHVLEPPVLIRGTSLSSNEHCYRTLIFPTFPPADSLSHLHREHLLCYPCHLIDFIILLRLPFPAFSCHDCDTLTWQAFSCQNHSSWYSTASYLSSKIFRSCSYYLRIFLFGVPQLSPTEDFVSWNGTIRGYICCVCVVGHHWYVSTIWNI